MRYAITNLGLRSLLPVCGQSNRKRLSSVFKLNSQDPHVRPVRPAGFKTCELSMKNS
jgi:hypothetical protein